jgi:two-component system, cell cycle response regulator
MSKLELLESMARHPDAPVFPSVAIKILDLASQANYDAGQLRSLIESEPVLASRVLKIINSPFFGLSSPIVAIGRAIQLLGARPLRSLVLGYVLASLQREKRQNRFVQEYWASSITGGVIARELSIRLGRPEPEDDFAAALMRDIGMLFLDRVHGSAYLSLREHSGERWWSEQIQQEETTLEVHHAEASGFYLEKLHLSPAMVEAVRLHHAPPEEVFDQSQLNDAEGVAIVQAATQATIALLSKDPDRLKQMIEQFKRTFGFSSVECDEFLEIVQTKVETMAEELGSPISDLCFHQVSRRATDALAEIAIQSSVESERTELKANQSREEAIRWRRTAYRLRRQTTRDPLTGVFNRSHFEEMLVTEFKRAQRRASAIGLLFLDVDQFKRINDTHGHAFGDRVLQAISRRLRQSTRPSDLVARYGGDEFCVIVVDIPSDGMESLANRLLEDLRQLTVSHGRASTNVAVSIGAVCCLPRRNEMTFERFLVASDEAMYAAKTQGKNQVHFASLLSPEDKATMEGIQARLFSRFLEHQGVASRQTLAQASRESSGNAFFMGRLARRLGWIGPRRLRRILFEQRKTHEMFGEAAHRLGYLTLPQVYSLLAIQQESPEEMIDFLVSEGVLETIRGRQWVVEYYRFLKSGSLPPEPAQQAPRSA